MTTVKQILAGKGTEVFTLALDASGLDAVNALSHHNVGALVVAAPDKAIKGIVSERDIMRALAKGGANALNQSVADLMTAPVQTCTEEASVPKMMSLMTEGRFRHLPVERDGKLVGLVSIGDIVKQRIAEIESEADDIRSYIASA